MKALYYFGTLLQIVVMVLSCIDLFYFHSQDILIDIALFFYAMTVLGYQIENIERINDDLD